MVYCVHGVGTVFSTLFLGGVLESNEIFNNKFSGICLATGVKPQLSSKFSLINQLINDHKILIITFK